MKIDIGVPNSMHLAATTQKWEYGLSGKDVGDLTQLADELGFYRVMLGEHFVIPNDHIELSGDHYLHVVAALSYFAGITKRIKLTSSASILSLQSPFVQAKAWATLDWLSGGRASPIFGVGWLKEEFDIMGLSFENRGKVADDYLGAIVALWTQDEPSFQSEHVSFKDIGFSPKPVQKRIPFWIGGDAKPALRRVAKFANGWSPFQTPPEQFGDCMDYIRSQPDYDGRPLDLFYPIEMLVIGAHHEIKEDPRAAGNWNPQLILDLVGWLKERGVNETIIPLPANLDSINAYKERLHWVAEEIISKIGD